MCKCAINTPVLTGFPTLFRQLGTKIVHFQNNDKIQDAVDTSVPVNDDCIDVLTPPPESMAPLTFPVALEVDMFTTTRQDHQPGHFVAHTSPRDADSTILSAACYTFPSRFSGFDFDWNT